MLVWVYCGICDYVSLIDVTLNIVMLGQPIRISLSGNASSLQRMQSGRRIFQFGDS
jgi:hypothetical protein